MALSDGIAGGLISAGSNLVGGIFNAFGQSSANKQNLKIARENNAANQQLQANQNAWNLQQWNRENAYNSASAQKQRLLDAGLNPSLALNNIATGSAQSNQLQSANYTPNQQVSVQPVTGFGNALSTAGTDFVSSFLNMRMNAAQVQKAEAEAQKALADAKYTSGVGTDFIQSQRDNNIVMGDLYRTQIKANEIANNIQSKFGERISFATLNNIISQSLKTDSDRNLNESQIKNVAQNTIKQYAETAKIKLEAHQISELTDQMVQFYRLKNHAQLYQNDMLRIDMLNQRQYGRQNAYFGSQSLLNNARQSYYDAKLGQKDNQSYWGRFASNTITDAFGAFRDFGIGSKTLQRTPEPEDYSDYDKHESSYKDIETGRTIKDTYYRKKKVKK